MAPMRVAMTVLACAVAAGSARAGETSALPWQEPAAKAAAAAAERLNANPPPPAEPAKSTPASGKPPVVEKIEPEVKPTAAKIGDPGGEAKGSLAKDPASKDAATKPAPPAVPAKKLFGAMKAPSPLKARAVGAYSRGCLAGASALPIDGPSWQAMRLSRNRNWGHPKLIALLERFAADVKEKDNWPGLLIGDISQPRGGPMLTGHASHQLGLDADIWFTPMPSRRLSKTERENLAATSMLASDNLSVNPKVFGDGQVKIVRRVASYAEVERVLVHPAIKKALCEAPGSERAWLSKVRPFWGHFYHFHVRMGCPADSAGCSPQGAVPGDDGCGKELDDWYKLLNPPPAPKPSKPPAPVKPKPPLTLADLPADCTQILNDDGASEPVTATVKPAAKTASDKSATEKPKAAKSATKPAAKKAASAQD